MWSGPICEFLKSSEYCKAVLYAIILFLTFSFEKTIHTRYLSPTILENWPLNKVTYNWLKQKKPNCSPFIMNQLTNTPFTEAEHRRFVTALEMHGAGKKGTEWSTIMEIVGTRNVLQVWQHAESYLKKLTASGNVQAAKPKISSGSWSWEENSIFEGALATITESSDRWRKIAQLLPDRTPSAVQKHYQLLLYDVTRVEAGEIAERQFYETSAAAASTKRGRGWNSSSRSSSRSGGNSGGEQPVKKRKTKTR